MAGDGSFLLAGAVCALTNAQTIELQDSALRVRDVISLDCIAAERRVGIGALPIAATDRRSGVTQLNRAALSALVRRRVPALGTIELSGRGDDVVELHHAPPAPPHSSEATCYTAVSPIPAGDAISANDVAPTPCSVREGARRVRYDRLHGVARATSDIAAGDEIGRLAVQGGDIADSGEELSLTVRVGPVLIERTVETLQPSTGGAVFVRDQDGEVFAAPLPREEKP